ncbi:ExeA family protein [Vibrio sinaloensis]|uniref:ExeA family protein n=1 Tax=Photobacterium sp. (strain ATCC 43367) TaxID=379097 RepID=UPI00205E6C7E|nr:AAA family ATPase [Vibrio sinaloensis]UPQ88292.1 AAA family ATPase [Vibrio sinaloensis]
MYLEHFGLASLPFHLTPDTEMFLGLTPHYEAIQTVLAALEMGEGVIKVTGEVGTGKTMLCRMLIKHAAPNVELVLIPNPALDGDQLRIAVANELGIESVAPSRVVDVIQQRLLSLAQQGKQVVVLVDEAQVLSDEALEVLRLFGNLETEQRKLMQIVLFGQPELDERLASHHLRQLRQRITFSAQLRGLTVAEVVAYIDNRLDKVGGETSLFSLNHKKAIWRASYGYPRLINQICHKALVLSCSDGLTQVSNSQLFRAIHDTYDSCKPKFKSPLLWGWS